MRARALLLATAALAGSAFLSWKAAERAADFVEVQTRDRIEAALADPIHDWITVATDGAIVILTGEAPNETSRFRTVEIVRQVVDPKRIVDQLTIGAPDPLTAPDFALEILRNGNDISLIGLAPLQSIEERAIRSALGDGRFTGQITNMLETADYPSPDGWAQSLGFGLSVISSLPRAKVSVTPGKVAITAVADSVVARDALEASLNSTRPEGVLLDLAISAPRPVITPFRFDYSYDGTSGALTACTAESEEDVAALLAPLRLSEIADQVNCSVGIGAPNKAWVAAVTASIDALHRLGGGSLTITDDQIVLRGAPAASADRIAVTEAALRNSLPVGYSLETLVQHSGDDRSAEAGNVPQFTAVLNNAGQVELTGVVRDATSRGAIESYAAALFGQKNVNQLLATDPALPEGWPRWVLSGLEALSGIEHGVLDVTSDKVVLTGWGVTENTEAEVSKILKSKVDRAEVDVQFDAAAADALAHAERIASLSRPDACAEEIGAILSSEAIQFGPGSAKIEPSSQGIISAIADILRQCPGSEFEVAGHTDNQGSDSGNLRLSGERARAVRDALEDADLPMISLSAAGYGADEPIADNGTDVGRRRNRRIELRLIREGGEAEANPTTTDGAVRDCDGAIANLLEDAPIEFALGSTTIAPASIETLLSVASLLRNCSETAFEVGGYTDNRGNSETNQRLSLERAEAVVSTLQGFDIGTIELAAKGYGSADPIADNDTSEGRSRNRRIEFKGLKTEDETDGAPAVQDGATVSDQAQQDAATVVPEAFEQCLAGLAGALADGGIQFAPESTTISDESTNILDTVAGVLRSCPGGTFEIAGHTDNQGSDSGNLRLSGQRAEAVLSALGALETGDVVLTARGYGEARPVADNNTRDGRALNRRIEITLLAAPVEPVVDAGGASNGPGEADEGVEPDTGVDLDADAETGADSEEMDHGSDVATSTPDGCERDMAGILAEGGIQFALSSATITDESAELVEGVAEVLRTCPDMAFEIGGYTDDRGSAAGNLNLSAKRAEAVRAALMALDPGSVTLTARGYGEENPVADNGTRDGRALNRRIEIRLVSAPAPVETTEPAAADATNDTAPDTVQDAADETVPDAQIPAGETVLEDGQ